MTREQVWGFACVWLHYTGRDSQLDRLSASLLGRGQVSVLRRSVCSACTCAQCVADPAAPRPCSVTALNHHDLDMGARRCLQEIGRIWEQNQPWGQFLLLRSFSSKTQASQWDTWRSSWAVLLQPACEDAGSGLSSPIHGLEVDVALSLEQKRSCNTIYSSFFFFVIIFLAVGLRCVIFSSALPKYNTNVLNFHEGPEELVGYWFFTCA